MKRILKRASEGTLRGDSDYHSHIERHTSLGADERRGRKERSLSPLKGLLRL